MHSFAVDLTGALRNEEMIDVSMVTLEPDGPCTEMQMHQQPGNSACL